jgi:urease accessory protein
LKSVTALERSVPRAIRVLPAQDVDPARLIDSVILDSAQRREVRAELVSVKGLAFVLALAEPGHLRTGDALELEDGRLIEVVAEAEPLLEVRAADPSALARIAWALGDRHVAVQLFSNRIRLRRDPALESLIGSLAGKCVAIEAPFDPEGGAYGEAAHTHSRQRHSHAHPHTHGSATGGTHDHDDRA